MQPERVWLEFVAKLRSGTLFKDDCRPLVDGLHRFFVGRQKEWGQMLSGQPAPRGELAGDKLCFHVPTDESTSVRLDFLLAEGRWYLFHIECITIPVREVTSLPWSDFPDLPDCETWMRE